MVQALFFDIDGTLVSFKTHRIPASALDALEEAHGKGIKIFIATGRPRFIVNNLGELERRGLIDGYITVNGAYCYVGDNVIYKSAIPSEDVRAIVDFCQNGHHECVFVGEQKMMVCEPGALMLKVFYEHLNVKELPVVSFDEAMQSGSMLQITPFITTEEEETLRPQMPHCESARWYPAFTDITACGNTKQRGIDEILRHFNLPLAHTMAFGDGGNDIGMLRHAAIGVAMGQAEDKVRQAADYLTASVDDDGVAAALRHFGVIG